MKKYGLRTKYDPLIKYTINQKAPGKRKPTQANTLAISKITIQHLAIFVT